MADRLALKQSSSRINLVKPGVRRHLAGRSAFSEEAVAFRLAVPDLVRSFDCVKGSGPAGNISLKEASTHEMHEIPHRAGASFCEGSEAGDSVARQTKVIGGDRADHLTVIEVSPGDDGAVGNQGAFSVERRENKVFVKPVEEGAKTNLFVWTTAGRFAYELVPAPSVEQMHFAIDQAPTPVAAKVPNTNKEEAVKTRAPYLRRC